VSIWLVRAGGSGEYENKFLEEGRIYVTWDDFDCNLRQLASPEELRVALSEQYPEAKAGTVKNWASQIWPFAKRMKIGDWVVLPSKKKASIHFAKITGDYQHIPSGPSPFFHVRSVDWFAQDIPRSNFDQDILYSFGAFMTICQITRNDAESRIKRMAQLNWKASSRLAPLDSDITDSIDQASSLDIERFAKDQMAKFISAKFSGHGMVRLVEAILKAKGFLTYRAPAGPDKGVDLLAAGGTLGFESPKICVQVKSGETPVDRPTLDQLIGAMQNFGAESGLLVSWAGFKGSVDKELPAQFFRVRLWDQDALIDELLECYDMLGEELRAELPFKRVWAIADSE
jgi:restriction system protein